MLTGTGSVGTQGLNEWAPKFPFNSELLQFCYHSSFTPTTWGGGLIVVFKKSCPYLELVNVILFDKRVFTDVINLGMSR